MLLALEILFAIWILSELCSALLGFGMLLLAIAAHLACCTLTGAALLVDMFCRLWKTAFYGDEG